MPPDDSTPLLAQLREAERNSLPPRQEIIVTLVHGTILLARWPIVFHLLRRLRAALARRVPEPLWHQPDSAFATALRSSLGEDCTEIRSFDWSGGNTVWHRLSAAGAIDDAAAAGAPARDGARLTLRQHIAQIADRHPPPAQVLIGHSHGGSVCLAALSDPETRQRVRAFVSLSTPYLHVRQRPDSQNVETALAFLGFLLFTAVMLTTMGWLESRVGEFWNVVVFTLAMFAVMTLGAAVWNRRRVRIDAVRAWVRSLAVDEEEAGAPARLIVISDGDEALLALKIAEALSAISRGLWRAAYRVVELVDRAWAALRWRVWILYACLVAVFLVMGVKLDNSSPWGPVPGVPWTIGFPLKVMGVSVIAPFLLLVLVGLALLVPTLGALLLGFPPLVFFRWLAFGWGGAPGVDVTAESLPLGTVTAVRLTAPTDWRGLRHSELYNDARVRPLIATFVQREVRRRPT